MRTRLSTNLSAGAHGLQPTGARADMTAHATHCFDQFAHDARWRTFTKRERRIVNDFVRRWEIGAGHHVLEPGCGTGRLTKILAGLTGPTGSVVAFDASPELIRVATRRQLPACACFHHARAETFRLHAAAFDHVVCFNVFPHLVPHAFMAKRLVKALRPGGIFWIAHTCGRMVVNSVHRAEPCMRDHLLPAPAKLERLLRDAGLREIQIEDAPDRFLARARRPR